MTAGTALKKREYATRIDVLRPNRSVVLPPTVALMITPTTAMLRISMCTLVPAFLRDCLINSTIEIQDLLPLLVYLKPCVLVD
jgi:hypothetical protein